MAARCTWKTGNGAGCPFPAVATGNAYGPKRWLCSHHVECLDGRAGDQIVFDEFNRRKAIESSKQNNPVDLADRVKRLQESAWKRSVETGVKLYQEGLVRAKDRSATSQELHESACAYMVQALSRPDVRARAAGQ